MPKYKVNVLGGWSKIVTAGSEYTAKTEALAQLRAAGHCLRPLNRDGSESYLLEDQKEGPIIKRRAEIGAMEIL